MVLDGKGFGWILDSTGLDPSCDSALEALGNSLSLRGVVFGEELLLLRFSRINLDNFFGEKTKE